MSVDWKVGDLVIIGDAPEIYPIVEIGERDGVRLFKLGEAVTTRKDEPIHQFHPWNTPISVRIC